MLGRKLSADDDRPGVPLVLILTHVRWSRRFNADRQVIGRAIQVDGKSATIVGVLPPAFNFFSDSELILPLGPFADQFYVQTRNNHSNTMVLGRSGRHQQLFRGFAMVIPGLALGVAAAWALGHYLQTQLYEISANDRRTYLLGVLVLSLSAFFACWLPARRAAKVDPMIALRDE
jgi:hypothetical protein